jgi:hypothetical protein
MLWLTGSTSMLLSTAIVTVNVVDPTTPVAESVAEIVVVPTDWPVASPSLPRAFEMVAAGIEEAHVTFAVSGCVLPSE